MNSAHSITAMLKTQLSPRYEVVEESLDSSWDPNGPQVISKQATKLNLKTVLDFLAGQAVDPAGRIRAASPDDLVILYICSHGYTDPNGKFYLVPYDTGPFQGISPSELDDCAKTGLGADRCSDARTFLAHSISSDDLTDWWDGVDAGQMTMVLDACHAAAIAGTDFKPAPLGDRGFGQLSFDKRMRILTAAQRNTAAVATLRGGVGLTGLSQVVLAISNSDPQLQLPELLKQAARDVPKRYRELYPKAQDAEIQSPVLFDFALPAAVPIAPIAHPDL